MLYDFDLCCDKCRVIIEKDYRGDCYYGNQEPFMGHRLCEDCKEIAQMIIDEWVDT